jgi:hypothetical protein
MPPISMKYFKDHVPNTIFNNQDQLAQILEKHHKKSIIESDLISPVTVRLFNVKNGLEKIEKCIKNLEKDPTLEKAVSDKYGSSIYEIYSDIAPSGSIY